MIQRRLHLLRPAPLVLRPDGQQGTWTAHPSGTPAAAVDDDVIAPTPVPATDYARASVAGRAIEFTLSPLDDVRQPRNAAALFYANTGPDTRLRVEVVTQGQVLTV